MLSKKLTADKVKNLNINIGLSFLALLIIVVFSLYYASWKINKNLLSETQNQLVWDITKIVSTSLQKVSFSGSYHANLFLEQILSEHDNILYLVVTDNKGKVLFDSIKNELDRNLVLERINSYNFTKNQISKKVDSAQQIRCCNGLDFIQAITQYQLSYDRKEQGYIFVGISNKDLNTKTKRLNVILIGASLILVLLSALFIAYISNLISKPVNEMALLFQTILDHAPMSIILRKANGNILECSDDFKKKFINGNQYTANLKYLIPEHEEIERLDEQLNSNIATQKEILLSTHDSKSYYNVINFKVDENTKSPNENIICTFALNIDQQKQIEKELIAKTQEANKASNAKTNFLASMSHEMRTPLTSIIGFIALSLEHSESDQAKRFLNIAYNASNNLLTIINDILDYSKIEANEIKLEKISFSLKQIMDEVFLSFEQMAKEKDLQLQLNLIDLKNQSFLGDPVRIRQIVINLLSNSIKFTKHGKIIITAKSESLNDIKSHITISVKDTGIGMTKAQQERIFERFSQADSSINRKFGGTGLGLSISKQLAILMHGTLSVESKINKGSTFTLELDLKKSHKNTEKKTNQIDINAKQLHLEHKKILIVDDDEKNRLLIEVFLKKHGFQSEFAINGYEAIDCFNKENYDLILMDIQMPEMDGLTATKEIRRLESLNSLGHTPIYAFTANVFKEQLETYYDSGFDGHLMKPFKKEDFIEFIVSKLVAA